MRRGAGVVGDAAALPAVAAEFAVDRGDDLGAGLIGRGGGLDAVELGLLLSREMPEPRVFADIGHLKRQSANVRVSLVVEHQRLVRPFFFDGKQ